VIVAIDPGTTDSAIVVLNRSEGVALSATWPNRELLSWLRAYVPTIDVLVVEQIAAMGMAVGAEVFETCVWSGRFIEAWDSNGGTWDRLKRLPVKVHLCGQARAKDANIRQALIDRYGGKSCTKKGGSLYGVKGDQWAALAVAVTYLDLKVAA
jgi:hypothetical protein